MIRAIVFDCFGVLTSDGWLPFKKKHFGHDPELSRQATDLNKQVDSGLADYQDFLHKVARLANVPMRMAKEAIEGNVANEELFGYIASELKPKYKIGLLSNAGANWLDDLFTPNQVTLFDATALSYETGVVKPDPRSYEAIVKRLKLEPQECVFVDDQEKYVTGAKEAGMYAVWYHHFDQFKADLEELLSDLEN